MMKNWSTSKGTRIRKNLLAAGLLEEYEINLYKPGKQIKIALPTKTGYELLDRRTISYKTLPGDGSIPHRFWQHIIAEKLRREGGRTEIEQSLGTKRVDGGAVKEGLMTQRVVYEVVRNGTLQKEISNMEKDLADGWDPIVFCVNYEETRERLAALLSESEDRVEIRLLQEFL